MSAATAIEITAITVTLIILAVVVVAGFMDLDCPRIIRGYNCKGDACDHSPEAIRQAKIDMNYWGGDHETRT